MTTILVKSQDSEAIKAQALEIVKLVVEAEVAAKPQQEIPQEEPQVEEIPVVEEEVVEEPTAEEIKAAKIAEIMAKGEAMTKAINERELTAEETALRDEVLANVEKKRKEQAIRELLAKSEAKTKAINERELTSEEKALRDNVISNIAKKREEKSAEEIPAKEEPAKEPTPPFTIIDAPLTQTGLQCMTDEKRDVILNNVFTMTHVGNNKYCLTYGGYKLTEPKYEALRSEFSFKIGSFKRDIKAGKFYITYEVKEIVEVHKAA